jgi:hypothetical protein
VMILWSFSYIAQQRYRRLWLTHPWAKGRWPSVPHDFVASKDPYPPLLFEFSGLPTATGELGCLNHLRGDR